MCEIEKEGGVHALAHLPRIIEHARERHTQRLRRRKLLATSLFIDTDFQYVTFTNI